MNKHLIRFRRLNQPIEIVDGIEISRWEVAFSEEHLWAKLDGEMAEIIMPAKSWAVRLWRRFFPLRAIEMHSEDEG
jgi:hypothetical protein